MTSRRRAASRPGPATLQVSVTDARGRALPASTGSSLAEWLVRAAPKSARGAVSLALISDEAMRRLNRDFRGKDRVTDVLSFPPASHPTTSVTTRRAASRPHFLGDLAIARGQAARQARRHGHPAAVEIRLLALHGLLHLLGYDHETDRGQMARIEARLRRRAGLPGVR